jgi:hypothetical protein
MVVWGFTAGVLDAVLTAAGLTRPWDTSDVRPLPLPGARAAALPGSVDAGGEEDSAAPTVVDHGPADAATRTVGPR